MKNPNSINKAIRDEAMRKLRAKGLNERQCRYVLAAKFRELRQAWNEQYKAVQ